MKKNILLIILIFFTTGLSFANELGEILKSDLNFFSPLGNDRSDYTKLKNRITGNYGDYRRSNVPGHKHSGIDIKGNFNEPVYSIGKGTVTHIFRRFPHKTIYIRHSHSKNMPFYSVYTHVKDIKIRIGDNVSEDTIIARIFNKKELEYSNFGTPPHLHFEIRHNIDDKGEASFKSMSISELNEYCIDPLIFFKICLENH